MATLTIRQLDEKTKIRLRVRAAHHGRSMEEEIRDILRDAVKEEARHRKGLGTEIAELFKGIELEEPIPKAKINLRIPKFD